jgi:hypothetical protein
LAPAPWLRLFLALPPRFALAGRPKAAVST